MLETQIEVTLWPILDDDLVVKTLLIVPSASEEANLTIVGVLGENDAFWARYLKGAYKSSNFPLLYTDLNI